VDHKVLERIWGFLVYTAGDYKPLNPFLLGLHLTIDSWRLGRDEEGWRLREVEVDANMESDEYSNEEYWKESGAANPLGVVKAVPSMRADLDVFIQLTEADPPPL
jgi:hypothetical protein